MAKAKKTKKTEAKIDDLDKPSRPSRKSFSKKLIDMQMTDGKLYNKRNVKSIDELLNINTNKYSTRSESDYEDYLNNLNTSDLQAHATTVGVLPNQDRNILVKRLLKEFRVHQSSYINTAETVNPFPKKITQRTLDILAQGR